MTRTTWRSLAVAALAALTAGMVAAGSVSAHGDRDGERGDRGDRAGKREGFGDRHHKGRHGKLLSARLRGDGDARGKAFVKVKPSRGKVCFGVRTNDDAGDVTAATINKGARGESGPVVVTLATEDDGMGCVDGQDASVLRDIKSDPRDYYVSAATTGGDLRGQLKRSGRHGGCFGRHDRDGDRESKRERD